MFEMGMRSQDPIMTKKWYSNEVCSLLPVGAYFKHGSAITFYMLFN